MEKKVLSQKEAEEAHVRDITWTFGHISRGMYSANGKPKPYSQLAAIQLGFLVDKGAAEWKADEKAANGEDTGCIELHLEKFPKEVEGLIDALDGVLESAVIGVPHRDFGEAVVAVIVRENTALKADAIETALSTQLAKFKQPKSVIFIDALPRNSMGKVQKAELRKTHDGLFS